MSGADVLKRQYALGGDFNERAANRGRYSPRWIAEQLHLGVFTPGPRSIDWLMASCPVTDVERVGDGGSDHHMVIFTVHYPGRGGRALALKGAIWNCERDRDPNKVGVWLDQQIRRHGLDFVLLQEAKQYHDALEEIAGVQVIAYGKPMGAQHNVIVVRDGVDVTEAEAQQMSREGWLLRGWGGDDQHAPSYATFATLNGWLHVGSVHEVVAVDWRERRGLWRAIGALDRVRARRQAARRYVARGRRVLGRNRKEPR